MGQDNDVAGWGTLCLINAGLAQAKARRGLVWFLLSLFPRPIAGFILVVLPFGEEARERRPT